MSHEVAAHDEMTKDALLARNALLAALVAQLTEERDKLRAAHERLRQELELLKRRIFVSSAERIDTQQLEMEFLHKLKELDALNATLEGDITAARSSERDPPPDDKPKKKSKPKGRRDLRLLDLPETRIEIKDPVFEAMVEQGKAEHAGASPMTVRVPKPRLDLGEVAGLRRPGVLAVPQAAVVREVWVLADVRGVPAEGARADGAASGRGPARGEDRARVAAGGARAGFDQLTDRQSAARVVQHRGWAARRKPSRAASLVEDELRSAFPARR
jgi:hypothetical protein